VILKISVKKACILLLSIEAKKHLKKNIEVIKLKFIR